jgi:hypothetical protein
MFILRQLFGKAQASSNVQLHLAFIDLAKAYDSVNWEALWQVLRTYGVLERLINLLQDFHSGTQAVVRLGGRVGRSFLVTSGVRQGCVVAPLLFNVFLDFIVKEALRAFPDYGVNIEFWSGVSWCTALALSLCPSPPLLRCSNTCGTGAKCHL